MRALPTRPPAVTDTVVRRSAGAARGPDGPPPRGPLAVVAVLAALAAVGLSGLNVLAWVARDTSTQLRTVDAEVRRVEVDVDGAVSVVGHDGPRVEIERQDSWSLARPQTEERVVGATLVLSGGCRVPVGWGCSVSYEIRVPAGTELRLRSSTGDIEAREVQGTVDADSSAGDVRLSGLAGAEVVARSGAGSVSGTRLRSERVDAQSSAGDVELSFDTAPVRVRAHSSAGDVGVWLPDGGESYSVRGDREGDLSVGRGGRRGGEHTVGVRTDPDSPRVVTASSAAGDVAVGYR